MTGRPVKDLRQTDELVGAVVRPGETLDVALDARHFLVKPGGTYTASLGGRPVGRGTYVAGADGRLTVNGAVTVGTSAGFQTLSISGTDAIGNPVEVRQTVYVAAGPDADDTDGDGLPDATDACPLTTQSGRDDDQDGLDDACDPLIAQPPVVPPGTPGGGVPDEGIVWWDNAILPIEIQTVGGP